SKPDGTSVHRGHHDLQTGVHDLQDIDVSLIPADVALLQCHHLRHAVHWIDRFVPDCELLLQDKPRDSPSVTATAAPVKRLPNLTQRDSSQNRNKAHAEGQSAPFWVMPPRPACSDARRVLDDGGNGKSRSAFRLRWTYGRHRRRTRD